MNAEVKSIWNIIDFGTYGNICRWGAILLHLTLTQQFLIVLFSPIINGANRGLKLVVHILNKFGAGQTKWSTFMYIISGWGRKSGGATPSLVQLHNAYIDSFTILVIFLRQDPN